MVAPNLVRGASQSGNVDARTLLPAGLRADLVRVHAHRLPATDRHPSGQPVPVVRALYREGVRVL